MKEKLKHWPVAGEMQFSDFDMEEASNSPISRVASSTFGTPSLMEDLCDDEDGKYFPNFYAYILCRFRQWRHRSRRNLRGHNLNLDDSHGLITDGALACMTEGAKKALRSLFYIII